MQQANHLQGEDGTTIATTTPHPQRENTRSHDVQIAITVTIDSPTYESNIIKY